MLKRFVVALLMVLSLSLVGCTASAMGGLQSHVDTVDGYRFLYPIGWIEVKVASGPDVVFRDLIEETENISVVINPIPANKTLEDLGSPGEVGYQLGKSAIAPPNSNRQAELVSADSYQAEDGKTYYLLEYAVKLPKQERHNLASVVVSHGKLYTLNASATEARWTKMQPVFNQMIHSFSVR
ncbi:photosystem II oxygen evolving complex protein PsbP [Leptolyngbya sp. 'hensonii']|uniref:photosystem II reaction center PsbP n=1 Tax=Leptolyngbya sp. 'hensonii' TaxID=1922337 RepID=UPI00094FAF8A|nr:photosystem II reaction center PsbP [Leptolyngbya sp. 'hensonii']OLP17267.1 photosystem II oxygen evolving complex protein PsbP [Leptolyngbya sp. 'hensonii']